MKKEYKAVKTEYKGTVYDSKSEAVFARFLDLMNIEYSYHPYCDANHEWDFCAYLPSLQWVDKQLVRTNVHTLIEYKPRVPTETYIDNLTKKMLAMYPTDEDHEGESILVWGNPWTGPNKFENLSYVSYPILSSYDKKYGWGDFCWWADCGEVGISCRHTFSRLFDVHNDSIIQEAKNYRFDLQD